MTQMSRTPEQRAEFLEQSVYRRRRAIDALKLLPVLGAALFLLPPLILAEESGSTALRLVYFFLAWVSLIVICAMLVRHVAKSDED